MELVMMPFVTKEVLDSMADDENLKTAQEIKDDNPRLIEYIIKASKCVENPVQFVTGALLMYDIIEKQLEADSKYED